MKKVKEQSATILVSGKSARRSAVIKALRFAFVFGFGGGCRILTP